MPFAHFRVGLDYSLPRGWADFDAVRLAEDLEAAASLGFDLLRVALPWEFLCPAPERASQVAMGKLLALLDAAHSRQIAVVPALFEGLPGYLAGARPWDDPRALRSQVRQVRQLGERFGNHGAIAAWDVGAAPERWWPSPPADGIWLWAQVVCGELRRAARQPVLLTLGGHAAPWPDVREHIDAAGVGAEPAGAAFARWPADPLVPAFRAAIAARLAGRRAIVMALDPDSGAAAPPTYHRDALEALWRVGAAGGFASFSLLCEDGRYRAHADDLASTSRQRRPLQPMASLPVDPAALRADPASALAALYHEFALPD